MKRVLFLVGPHAAGKTYTVRNILQQNDGFSMIDTGPIMRNLHSMMNPELSMGEWVEELEKIYGKDVTSELISKEILKVMSESSCENLIIIGFRSLQGINYVTEHLGIEDRSILYVDASPELLYFNYVSREDSVVSLQDYQKYISDELKLGLDVMRELALSKQSDIDYFYKTANNDDLQEIITSYFDRDYENKLVRFKNERSKQ